MSECQRRILIDGDLTASPASVIWTLGVYRRMNFVTASPTARHIVIHPQTAPKLVVVVKKSVPLFEGFFRQPLIPALSISELISEKRYTFSLIPFPKKEF